MRGGWLVVLALAAAGSIALASLSQAAEEPEARPEIASPPFPALQAHPLPPSLAQPPLAYGSDYSDRVEPSPLGYLVWSEFPVRVWIDAPRAEIGAERQRFEQWRESVRAAAREWSEYLPLTETSERERADIAIVRESPPVQRRYDAETGRWQLGRQRTAQTSYEFYLQKRGDATVLAHRMTIQLRPHQAPHHQLATARHELGHALGIWGHSDNANDALYAAQVSVPPPISNRDVGTLRHLYQQPTRLGWPMLSAPRDRESPEHSDVLREAR